MVKQSYAQKVQDFGTGKRLKCLGWFDKETRKYIYCQRPSQIDESTTACQCCGSKAPRSLAVLLDAVSGIAYLVGANCYRKLNTDSEDKAG